MQSNFLDWLISIDALSIKTELTPISLIVKLPIQSFNHIAILYSVWKNTLKHPI